MHLYLCIHHALIPHNYKCFIFLHSIELSVELCAILLMPYYETPYVITTLMAINLKNNI